jgi:hypothetical protein
MNSAKLALCSLDSPEIKLGYEFSRFPAPNSLILLSVSSQKLTVQISRNVRREYNYVNSCRYD